ncbi:heavy metal translocating P-type ATPase [Shewanella sp. GXUN23E]|uniref:heavy metal translocating P-type ATPase n=1 Tax=Shewanella sp. GXUN23E TaxID=3422498 RepID=UPI003D7EAC97
MTFYVPDMSCASCVAKIEKAFDDGSAVVNLADKQVQVAGSLSADDAIARIASAGYRAELVVDAREAAAQKQLNDKKEYRTRMIEAALGLGLGIPLMLWGLAGGEMMINSPSLQLGWGIVGVITGILLVTTGKHFYQGMWRALKVGSSNMDTLIVLGTTTAWLYSMLVVLFPQYFPASTRHVYFEASVMILGLINLGHALELRARGKTSEAVQKLIGMQSTTAIRVTAKGDEEVEISALRIGDRLRLKPGARVALDGSVESGSSALDESMLTGEPVPVMKHSGDSLSAGTVNGNGVLVYRVTALAGDTKLAKIISLVQQAQTSKMPIGRLTDKIAAYFVPVVVVIALLSSVIWYLAGPAPALSHALVVLTSVLIIACPCALGLATPMSIMVSVGRAAQMGVLVKNGEALQTASKVDTVVLDKTGTVTLGKPQVTDMLVLNQVIGEALDETALLQAIGSLEQHSEHPLASAMVARAKEAGITLQEPEQFDNHQGRGITGEINGARWAIGNAKLMQQQSVTGLEGVEPQLANWASAGKTPVYVALNGQLAGMIAISDPVKEDAAEAIAVLKKQGIRVVMLTGDNEKTARAVAAMVGIDEVIANVLPDEKQAQVLKLKSEGRIVAMVGDGINDAPALVSADVGIAMGSGTEVAIESADFTLLSHKLTTLGDALALSRATMANIKQNLFGAFIYNTLGIPVAAGVLFPLTGILLSPVVAGAAMALSSLTVVTNANRLKVVKLR